MALINDLFPTQDLLDFSNQLAPQALLGETLFPRVKKNSNDIKVLLPNSVLSEIAHVHGFDTETEVGARKATVASVTPFYFKRNKRIGEEELVHLNEVKNYNPQEYDFLVQEVYNDFADTVNSINTAIEQTRMQALTNGVINIKGEDGKTYKLDYKLASSQKHSVDWTASNADILSDLQDIVSSASVTPTRALTNQHTMSFILRNQKVHDAIFGTTNSQLLLTLNTLNQFLASAGLPVFAVYNNKYLDNGVPKTYIDDGQIALFLDGIVGQTVFGVTPEESHFQLVGDAKITSNQFIFSKAYSKEDPYQEIIGATAMAVPALAQKQYLQIVTAKIA